MPNLEEFKKDLEDLINKHSLENLSDTPDFILAEYLVDCLVNYNRIVSQRDKWFSVDMWHGRLSTAQYVEPPENSQTPTTCDICGEDLSLWAGICPKQHDVLGDR